MGEWKQVNKLGLHKSLEQIILNLKDVVDLEIAKNNKKIEALKRISEMKDKKQNG